MNYIRNNNFKLYQNLPSSIKGGVFIVQDTSDKVALLENLKREIGFPDYFGKNWDALDEVLRDLNWLDDKNISIYHKQLPNLTKDDLQTYMNILSTAVDFWNKTGERKLEIYFPVSDTDRIDKLGG